MRKYIPLFALLMLQLAVAAQETFNLKKCIDIAMENNYSLKISQNSGKMDENNLSLANAGYLPNIDISTAYSGSLNNTRTESSAGEKSSASGVHNMNYNAGANLTWTIFSGFRISATYDKLKELKTIGEIEVSINIENMIYSLTSEYYNYIIQERRYNNLKYLLSLSRERLRITEAQYQLGARSKLEVLQARVDYNVDSSSLVNQIHELSTSITRLKTIMCLNDKFEEPLIFDIPAINIDSTLDYNSLLNRSLQNNLTLMSAARAKEASVFDKKIIRSNALPYLRLNAGYGYTLNRYGNNSIKVNENLGLNYGLTLGINILDGFNYNRNIKNANLDIANKELVYKEMEQQIRADLFDTYHEYRNNLQLLNLERENLSVAREKYEIAMERYKLGVLSGIELREAQQSLQDAEDRMLLVEYHAKADEITLMRISGQINSYVN